MFPERRTAKLLSSGAAKLRYSCNDGLAPYFRQILTEKIQESEICVVSFNESLNYSNQKCQVDSIVKYWSCFEQKVKIEYFQSSYLDYSTHTNLPEHFKCIETPGPSKIIQVSMDVLSVNLEFYKELTNKRSDSAIPALIDFGSSSLHITNGAFQREQNNLIGI